MPKISLPADVVVVPPAGVVVVVPPAGVVVVVPLAGVVVLVPAEIITRVRIFG